MCYIFFVVPLSLVLDGFEQLIKLLMHCPCCQLTWQHQEKSWKRRDSNPGRRGAELERYSCAMATPPPYSQMSLSSQCHDPIRILTSKLR